MPYEDYNIDHLIHHIANFSYTTSLPCKNKLDASNTLLLDYVAARVSRQTVATYAMMIGYPGDVHNVCAKQLHSWCTMVILTN